MKNPDAKKKGWLQFRLQASSGFVGLPNRMVDGKAFAALTTGASVKTLVWFWQMVVYGKRKRKPGQETPIGRVDRIENNGELSFTYQEAEWRGMNARRFSRALKELHRMGFIDVARLGRGVRGEYTRFAISTRWERFGSQEWEEIPYPENFREGWRSTVYRKRTKKITDENVRYSTDENVRCEQAATRKNGRKRPLKSAESAQTKRTKTSVSIDSVMGCGSKKNSTKGFAAPDSRFTGAAAASFQHDASPSNGRKKKSDLEKAAGNLLSRVPERAGDKRLLRFLVSQLLDVQSGLLDPMKVRATFEGKERLPSPIAGDILSLVASKRSIPLGGGTVH